MSKKTKNLNLVLPAETDAYNIDVFNDNFQLIDEAMEHIEENTEDLSKLQTNDKTSLVNAINEVFQIGGDVRQKTVDAIHTADSNIKISTENTYDEIYAAIIKIAKNWEARDRDTRIVIAQACNDAETTDTASLPLAPPWVNIKKFILTYLKKG